MITVKISNNGESTHVRFPCRETELEGKLEEIGAYGRQNAPHFYIEDVTEPAELAELKGRNINLDELNYFAKRLGSFVTKEKGLSGNWQSQTEAVVIHSNHNCL